MVEFSSQYKKGFREGYSNPSQFNDMDLNKEYTNPKIKEYVCGVIAGKIRRHKDIQNNTSIFMMSDKDLKSKIE